MNVIKNEPAAQSPGRTMNRLLWGLRMLVALVFLASGGIKLAGVPAMITLFDTIGMGDWFRYFTGIMEVTSAVMLVVPGWARFGALNLVMTALGAVATHLFKLGDSPAVPLILGLLAGVILWGRWNQSLSPWRTATAA